MSSTIDTPRLSRRNFLQRAAVASMLIGSPVNLALAQRRRTNQGRRVEDIGIQLYSLRQEMAADFEGTLSTLAEIGFKEMEFAGYHGRTVAEVRGILDDLGLTSPAAHIQLAAIRQDLQREIEAAATLGQRYIVVPSLPGDERSGDDYRGHAETLNRAGEACKRAGIKMGYHNHAFEFDILEDGAIGFDILLEETDPELVDFEMDLYWIAEAGYDPIFYFLKYPGRFPMLHVKDRDYSGGMVDVGRGEIDFSTLFTYVETAGFQHFFIEHDNPSDGINSMTYSYNSVSQIRY